MLGVVGFVAGGPGTPDMPGMAADSRLLKVIPGVLELGTSDHSLHIILGIAFLAGGLLTRSDVRRAAD